MHARAKKQYKKLEEGWPSNKNSLENLKMASNDQGEREKPDFLLPREKLKNAKQVRCLIRETYSND
jgi:hypothetical protein